MASTAELLVRLRADVGQLQSGMRQASASLKELEGAANNAGGAVGRVGKGGGGLGGFLGRSLETAVGIGVANVVGKLKQLPVAAVEAAMDFEDSFARLEAQLTKVNTDTGKIEHLDGGATTRLRDDLVDLSHQLPVAAKDLANVAAIGAKMDIPADRLKEFTDTVERSAMLTGMDPESLAQSVGMIQALMPDSKGKFKELGASIAGIGSANIMNESDVLAMAARAAPAASMFGMSTADLLSWSATLRDAGVQSELGGTAISQIMTQTAVSVAAASSDMAASGKAVRESFQKVGDLGDDLELLHMQKAEMFTKHGKLKKQYRKHPSEVFAMDLREKRLTREITDAQADYQDKLHPGRKKVEALSRLTGMSSQDIIASMKDKEGGGPGKVFEAIISGLSSKETPVDVIEALEESGFNGIRELRAMMAAGNPESLKKRAEFKKIVEQAFEHPEMLDERTKGITSTTRAEITKGKNALVGEDIKFLLDNKQTVIDAYSAFEKKAREIAEAAKQTKEFWDQVPEPIRDATDKLVSFGAAPFVGAAIGGGLSKILQGVFGGGGKTPSAPGGSVPTPSVPGGGGGVAVEEAAGAASILGSVFGVLGIVGAGIGIGKLLQNAGVPAITQGELHPPTSAAANAIPHVIDVGGIHIDLSGGGGDNGVQNSQAIIEETLRRVRERLEAALGSRSTPVNSQMGGAYASPKHQ